MDSPKLKVRIPANDETWTEVNRTDLDWCGEEAAKDFVEELFNEGCYESAHAVEEIVEVTDGTNTKKYKITADYSVDFFAWDVE